MTLRRWLLRHATADAFEFMSRRTAFRRGTGLPGLAWDSGLPVFMPDLGKGSRFLRSRQRACRWASTAASRWPAPAPTAQHHVVAFLSALATPIVRRFEVWQRDGSAAAMRGVGLLRDAGRAGGIDRVLVERGQGTLGRAFLTGVPVVGDDALSEPAGLGASVQATRLCTRWSPCRCCATAAVVAVMAWYF